VGDVLDKMHDHGAAAFLDHEEALDAEKIGPAQRHQDRHCLIEAGSG
jgi:hypothetical protein